MVAPAGDSGRWLQELPRSLKRLDIKDCPAVSADGLRHITRLSKLEGLTLDGLSAAAMSDAGRWLKELPRSLRSLAISDCQAVSADGLCYITRLSKLEGLALHGMSSAAMSDAGRWLQRLPRSLKRLDIGDCQAASSDGLGHITRLPKLKILTLRGLSAAAMSDAGRWLKELKLKILTLHGTSAAAMSDAGRWLKKLPQSLKWLDIGGCQAVSSDGLGHITRLPKLKSLILYGLSAAAMSDGGRWLKKLPRSLEWLVISDAKVPLELDLTDLPHLRELCLRGCDGLTDTTLAGLPTSLEKLTIADCSAVSPDGLSHLTGLSVLKELTLASGPAGGLITDALLDVLHGCSRLQTLQLGDPEGSPETAITAAAVGRLAVACRRLLELKPYTTAANALAVRDVLSQVRADLGSDSDGRPRTIRLVAPVQNSYRQVLKTRMLSHLDR